MGQAQVDEDGRLDDRDENKGQAQALFHQGDDEENGDNGHRVDHLEVLIRGFDHVLHAGGLADEHSTGVIPLQDGAQPVDLRVDLLTGHLIGGVDQHQLPLVAAEDGGNGLRQDLHRHPGTQYGLQSQDVLHAVHRLHLFYHGADVLGGDVRADQQHVGGGDVEVLRELTVGDDILHVLRQAPAHVVVDLLGGLMVAGQGRGDHQGEDHQEHGERFDDAPRHPGHVRDEGLVPGPLQGPVEHQNEGGQHGHAAQHPQQDPLGHHDAQVAAHGEAHEAQGDEARHRGDGGTDHASQGGLDGGGHGLALVPVEPPLLVITVPQEDGIVHRNGQLKYGGEGFGNVRDLPHEVVAAQVHEDHHPDAGQEHKGDQPAVQQEQHGSAGQGHRDAHIDGLLLLAQVLQVRHQGRHPGDEALLSRDAPDLPNGVHGQVGGGGGVKEHGHHGGAAGVERIIQLPGQQLHGDRQIQQGIIPQHGLHMVHLLDLRPEGGSVPVRHVLQDEEGEGPLAKFIQELVLPDHGVHVGRKVVQHIVVDARPRHPQNGGNQQEKGQNEDGDAVSDHRFGKTHE